jgi:hypothetical protein
VPDAIPDPINPVAHGPNDEVQVPGATIVFLGLAGPDGEAIARFQVADGALPDARLLTEDGRFFELHERGEGLESEPFDARGSDTITLVVGEVLVVFEVR